MSEEAKEAIPFYCHATKNPRPSAKSKLNKALNYLNRFLEDYCKHQLKIDVVTADKIPYEGIPPRTKQPEIQKFWDDLINCFITYIGEHASYKRKADSEAIIISKQTAEGYTSSVKSFFTDKFQFHTPRLSIFEQPHWSKALRALRALKKEHNRKIGKSESTEEVSSTRVDREALAKACIWKGTSEFAEYWHLLNTTYHCCGRGSEVSLIKSEAVTPYEVHESTYRYTTIAASFQRVKEGPFQTLPLYPYRDGVLEDFLFSLIHLLVVNGCSHDYVCPRFAEAALHVKKSGELDSVVSKRWNKLFEEVCDEFDDCLDINNELGSHSNRRGSSQVLAEAGSNFWALVYRMGIQARGAHTAFDYVNGTSELLRQGGKTLSRWTAKSGETTIGGQPPSFSDIRTHVPMLRKFTDEIFKDDVEFHWHPKVREILIVNMLLRYDQFVEVLKGNLNNATLLREENRFDAVSPVKENLFLSRLAQALAKVNDEEWNDKHILAYWKDEATEAFLSRNGNAIPIQMFPLYKTTGPTTIPNFTMDSRCFVDHFNELASVTRSNQMELQRHRHLLNDMHYGLVGIETQLTNKYVLDKLHNLEIMFQRLEGALQLQLPPPPALPAYPPPGQIRFTVLCNQLSKRPSVVEVMTGFFLEDYRASYALEKKSPWWQDKPKSEREAVVKKFCLYKRIAKVVLGHADAYPLRSSKPSDRAVITGILTVAENKLRERLGIAETGLLTVSKLEKQLAGLKDYEQSLELPTDTPLDMRDFFSR